MRSVENKAERVVQRMRRTNGARALLTAELHVPDVEVVDRYGP